MLTGWYVLDLAATIVTCTSRKEGAVGTFKGAFGHMLLGAWMANTRECAAMLLRPSNAPPNDVADQQDGPGRRAAATPAATVVEAAAPDRRRGLQP